MIGQKNNIKTLIKWRCNKSIPRFIIISGDLGSGRLTFAKAIMHTLKAPGIICDCGIDDVRRTIDYAYSYTTPTVYIFRNADDMSLNAKNALLKVVEEPPNNAYFIMTVQNLDNMLGTIRSRATTIKMEPYSHEELTKYCEDQLFLKYCYNIGQLQISKDEIEKAEECSNSVMDALLEKSGTKLLKACTLLRNKQTEEDKIDCLLFFRIFEKNVYKLFEHYNLPISIIRYITDCKKEIVRTTINKKASIECMLVNILEVVK